MAALDWSQCPAVESVSGFNHQNVLSALMVITVDDGHKLVLGDCYGLAGSIMGNGLSLSFREGIPPKSVYRG